MDAKEIRYRKIISLSNSLVLLFVVSKKSFNFSTLVEHKKVWSYQKSLIFSKPLCIRKEECESLFVLSSSIFDSSFFQQPPSHLQSSQSFILLHCHKKTFLLAQTDIKICNSLMSTLNLQAMFPCNQNKRDHTKETIYHVFLNEVGIWTTLYDITYMNFL